MSTRTVGLVWGYLPGVDTQCQVADDAGLPQRFSLAFDRYPDSGPGVYDIEFDRELVVGTVNCLLQLFPHDKLVAADWNKRPRTSLSEACLADEEGDGYDSFGSIRLTTGDALVCYIEHEAYQLCGGPHPYHDAFVYAFYCADMERNVVQNALFAHAAANDILVSDVVSAAERPVKPSWWRRLRYWLR